jgi:hypothetical protein
MRTHSSLERLAVAGRPLLADVDVLVDRPEQEQILGRIVTADRSPVRRRRPISASLVAAGLIAVAGISAWMAVDRSSAPSSRGYHRVALTGARLELAGYNFKTPAGFVDSNSSCEPGATGRFSAAASADGGCVSAYFVFGPGASVIAPDAQPIDVAGEQGFLVTGGDSLTLYAPLPKMGEDNQYLMLIGKGLTADELVAIAESGLSGTS